MSKLQNDGLTQSDWPRMLCGCTHMAIVGVKRLTIKSCWENRKQESHERVFLNFYKCALNQLFHGSLQLFWRNSKLCNQGTV